MSWIGLAAPKGIPAPIIEFINASVRKALVQPDMKQRLDDLMATAIVQTVPEFTSFMNSEMVRYEKLIKEQNIKY